MSVIIRLQNLPWSANAMDIRTFFRGLSIPEGGVHIVGGEQGDAFIAFSTDEDARQAMMNDGGKIKEVQVKLLLSSRSEMHKVIESARQNVSFLQLAAPAAPLLSGVPAAAPEPPRLSPDKDRRRDRTQERKPPRSESRDRDKSRARDKKDRRSRSRSRDRDRRRRDRSRSRERRERKRDRKERSRERVRPEPEPRARPRPEPARDDPRRPAPPGTLAPPEPPYAARPAWLGPAHPPGPAAAMGVPGMAGMSVPAMAGMSVPGMAGMSGVTNMSAMGNAPNVGNVGNMGNMGNMGGMPNMMNQQRMPLMSRMPVSHNHPAMGENGVGARFGLKGEQMHRLQELGDMRNPNAFQMTDKPLLGPRPPYQNGRPRGDPRGDPRGGPGGPGGPVGSGGPGGPGGPGGVGGSGGPGSGGDPRGDPRGERFRPQKGFCVQLRRLPPHAGYGDVRRFFTGHYITNQGLKFINDDAGKRTGVVFVKFCKYESKQDALRRSGAFIKGESVSVGHLEEEEFDSAVDSFRPSRESDESGDDGESQKSLVIVEGDERPGRPYRVLVLEDLPAFAKEQDIIKMFSDYSLLSILLVVTKDVKKQYLAYVEFVNAEDAKAALEDRSKHLIGHKVVRAFPSSESAYEQAKANAARADRDAERPPGSRAPPARDPRHRERPFEPAFPGPRGERFPWRPARQPGPPDFRPPPGRFGEGEPACALLKGLPLRTTDRDVLDFFSDVGVIPAKIHLMLTVQGRPSGDCFCEFAEPGEAAAAASKHGAALGAGEVSVELVGKAAVDEALGRPSDFGGGGGRGFRGGPRGFPRGRARGRGFGGGRGGGPRFPGPPGDSGPGAGPGPEGFGQPGCVVSLENVPFRSGVDEIVDFFRDYELSQNDVIRRFNENGHPTGDARVNFRSPQDAQRAIERMNQQCIRDRALQLTLL